MLKKFAFVFSCMLLIALSGCASVNHIQLSDKARSEVQSVAINPDIQVNQDVLFYGMSQAMAGAVGGVVGGAIAGSASDNKTVLKSLIETNDIKVDQIFRANLMNQLEQSRVFPKVVEQNGDAVFNISIVKYGLFKKSTFANDLRAAVWANVSLTRLNGDIIWQKRFNPRMSEDRVPAYDLAYYQQHPDMLRKGYDMAIEIIAKEIVEDLKGSSE